MPTKNRNVLVRNRVTSDFVPNRGNAIWVCSSTGQTNRGWRQRIKQGYDVTSNYSADVCKVLESTEAHYMVPRRFYNFPGSPGGGIETFNFEGYYQNCGTITSCDHVIGTSPADEAQALSRMYDRIRSESYSANGLLFLGELRETIHLIRHPLEALETGLRKYMSALKSTRRDVSKRIHRRKSETDRFYVRRRLDAVKNAMAGEWLAFRFGALPAISDAKDLAEASLNLIYGRIDKTRLRSKSTERESAIESKSTNTPYACIQIVTNFNRKTSVSVQYVCGLKRTLDAPTSGLQRIASETGFQLQNFVPTVYNLIPYSFLVDYVSNLGNVIEAACTDTSNVTFVCKTVKQVTSLIANATQTPYNETSYPCYRLEGSPTGTLNDSRVIQRTTLTRTALGSLGIPPLVLSMPGIDDTKWLNVVALLSQSSGLRYK